MKKRAIQSSLTILGTLVLLMAILFSLSRYMHNLVHGLDATTLSYLEEIARLNALSFRGRVDDNLRALSSFASLVAQNQEASALSLLSPLQDGKEPDMMQYIRLGIATPDGRTYTSDQHVSDISYRNYFLAAMDGQAAVSGRLTDAYTAGDVNVFSVPIYAGEAVGGVLFAVVSNEDFLTMLPAPFVGQQGLSMVAEKDGRSVAGSLLSTAPGETASVFDARFSNAEDAQQILMDFQHFSTGTIRYRRDGVEWYASYVPLGLNDWFLLTAVPVSATAKNADQMILLAWVTWSAVTLVLIALLVAINVQRSLRVRAYIRYVSIDEATGIRNWYSFCQKGKAILQTHPPASYVFVRIGIDRYQMLQDFFGEDAARTFLRSMAHMLEQNLWPTELCAHYVDDTFVLLLHYQLPKLITKRLQTLMDSARDLQPNFPLPFSCGVVEVESPATPLSTLLEQAKYVCQHIVELHDTHICFFDEDQEQAMRMEARLEQHMYEAIRREQFTVYFQPKYSLSQRRYVGAEALVRWIHPEYGFLSPGVFIPFFEKNGFITTLDLYVLEHVCALLRQWEAEGRPLLPVSVNLSKLHMVNADIVATLLDIVRRHELPPSLMEIELTESAFVNAMPMLVQVIDQLHAAGFTVAMDDFGTGYSSLGLLHTAPVDVIKLDRAFFSAGDNDLRRQIILRNVVHMVDELSIRIVSEGIETDDQVHQAQALGCDLIQGYRFGKPMPAEAFAKLLAEEAARDRDGA